jgi:signal transduction histidine kinase
MGEFASRVSHEIRNPLTSIKLNLQDLNRDVEAGTLPERAARPVEICLREVRRLDAAVRRVLETARTHPPGRVRVPVHVVLDDALALMEPQFRAQGVRVHRRFRAERDGVTGDPEDLKGAFLHLLANAQEAMPEGGQVDVETEGNGAGSIRVRIRDEGGGVPPEIRDEVFRPFVSTKGEGTGFGLPTARRIVQDHGGRLALEEGSDEGAAFVIELPLEAESS